MNNIIEISVTRQLDYGPRQERCGLQLKLCLFVCFGQSLARKMWRDINERNSNECNNFVVPKACDFLTPFSARNTLTEFRVKELDCIIDHFQEVQEKL